ncbi:tubulin-specific chaperone E isoform X2 [Girardinichthys multiradiatus]|uniref:tubulin-specific chaperone E isoform X2 n=1 Tax=Girardinichthys multiradiatus TaxID=208333 RepID=UPI001FABF543|nr:tubulin-specific chaperone E isoform X2 [Girardinichthys multiradiatus]
MRADRTKPEMPLDPVGKRVSCGGERATVRYVGHVPPYEGLWIGVEWDNPERGKHDGSHEGMQYFTCRNPKGGSFVRPVKVSFGVDFLTAFYMTYQFSTEKVLSEEISISSKRLEWFAVQERRFESLPSIVLNHCEVNGPGAPGEIRKTTPNVQWLDLSGSLVSTWEDVAAITEQLENLEGLQLSVNRISLTSDPWAHLRAFGNLKVLALNTCDITWLQILECAPMWPQLEDLSVENNNITELQRPEGVLETLKCLNLSCNALMQESVCRLSTLPRLEQLDLSSTRLSFVQLEDAAQAGCTAIFPALACLNLDHNNISEVRLLLHAQLEHLWIYGLCFHLMWCVVNELAKIPFLVKLSCRDNKLPSIDGNPNTVNQIIIAKLGQLIYLNNSEINSEERKGAELDYIKLFGEQWLKAGEPGQPSIAFTRQHPRYQTLIDKYGAPDEGELKKQEPFALKNQLLKITFVFPDDTNQKPIEKKLPASMVVQKVKGLLHRLLKVPSSDLRLTYTSHKMLGTEFDMDGDLKTLQFYSIEDGDQVLVRWS